LIAKKEGSLFTKRVHDCDVLHFFGGSLSNDYVFHNASLEEIVRYYQNRRKLSKEATLRCGLTTVRVSINADKTSANCEFCGHFFGFVTDKPEHAKALQKECRHNRHIVYSNDVHVPTISRITDTLKLHYVRGGRSFRVVLRGNNRV
jgi:hypothetical protein